MTQCKHVALSPRVYTSAPTLNETALQADFTLGMRAGCGKQNFNAVNQSKGKALEHRQHKGALISLVCEVAQRAFASL